VVPAYEDWEVALHESPPLKDLIWMPLLPSCQTS
jgi:hypothetical protein